MSIELFLLRIACASLQALLVRNALKYHPFSTVLKKKTKAKTNKNPKERNKTPQTNSTDVLNAGSQVQTFYDLIGL